MSAHYEGPTNIDCAEKCEVPAGVTLSEVPQPRHNWCDVFGCPNDGCGRWWLALRSAAARPTEEEK